MDDSLLPIVASLALALAYEEEVDLSDHKEDETNTTIELEKENDVSDHDKNEMHEMNKTIKLEEENVVVPVPAKEDSFFDTIPGFLRVDLPKRISSKVLDAFRNPISMPDMIDPGMMELNTDLLDLDMPPEEDRLDEASFSSRQSYSSSVNERPNLRKSTRIKATTTEPKRSIPKTGKDNTGVKRMVATKQSTQGFSRVTGRTAAKLMNQWNDLHKQSFYWMKKLLNKTNGTKTAFNVFFFNTHSAFKATLSSKQPRPIAVHQSMLHLIVDYLKLLEIAKNRGMEQVIGLVQRLTETVFGLYLGDPNRMFATNLAWVQTKEFFELMFSMLLLPEMIYGFFHMFNKMESFFIKKSLQRKKCTDEYVAFCLSQFGNFRQILNNRLNQLTIRKSYNAAI